jgi:mannose-6-phosphate isomerase
MNKSSRSTSVFEKVIIKVASYGFKIVGKDLTRPWGGFLVIDEAQVEKFIDIFFPEIADEFTNINQKLSPKILIIKPKSRLSWQYHNRREEVWKIIEGSVGIITSDKDTDEKEENHNRFELIRIKHKQRHRLVGLKDWGIVAEIWKHTDTKHPSNEEDIIRVSDDYGR